MFKRPVSVTALTSPSANEFFTNIQGDSFNGDTTFVATLRALLANRIPDGDSVYLTVSRSTCSSSDIETYGKERTMNTICDSIYSGSGQFYVHNLAYRDDSGNKAIIDLLREKFPANYPGWHEVAKIGEFYHKSFNVICFVNEEIKSTAVFVDQLNMQKWHYLQMAILAILTWYFDPEQGVTELEMNLIQSIRNRESDEYEACIAKIAEAYDFETARLKRLLKDFETQYERSEMERTKREIATIDRNIDNLSDQFASYNNQRNQACIRLLGLQQKIAEGSESTDILDYFLCNRGLRLESVDNSTMTFVVRTYLDYFDEDMVQRAIQRKSSDIYLRTSSGMNKDDIARFMKAVFIDQKLRIRFCAAYRFDLNGSVKGLSGYSFDSSCAEYMPNPHIQGYHCLGGYEVKINKCIKNGDYIGAIAQCTASAKSLNFGDGIVIGKFMEWIVSGPCNKCVELPDGKVVKPAEAVVWLKNQETQANAEVSAREQ